MGTIQIFWRWDEFCVIKAMRNRKSFFKQKKNSAISVCLILDCPTCLQSFRSLYKFYLVILTEAVFCYLKIESNYYHLKFIIGPTPSGCHELANCFFYCERSCIQRS